MSKIFGIHNIDARDITSVIKKKVVDVTITSPPYFNLKDYGHEKQIGFGQKYNDYLEDLKHVFTGVYKITKTSGSLFIIIDTYRENGEVVLLPFDLSSKLKEIGWILKDIIIWHKDKTVPWAHKGQMRSSFEYILFFVKSEEYKFDIDKLRDFSSLKKWWVKYPERYNPFGKAPEEIWDFSIPTQGSWGSTYVRHFCPLPSKLVDRMIKLTTDENEVVLDPFSGSGTVLAESAFLERKYIGFELNPDYITMFRRHLAENLERRRTLNENLEALTQDHNDFSNTLIDLRALKYCKIILKEFRGSITRIYVDRTELQPNQENKVVVVRYVILANTGFDQDKLIEFISKPPLSKFGVQAIFEIIVDSVMFESILESEIIYGYTSTNTWMYKSRKEHLHDIITEPIVSSISVYLNEKDYE